MCHMQGGKMKTPFLPKDARCDASSIKGSPEAKEEIFRGRYSYIVVITLIVTAKCYVYQLWLSLCSFFFSAGQRDNNLRVLV